ncbi:MAG: lipoyl(octanoyl) transferase LipB, partial [Armatimonadetes bacterium]|nr:lipoyl(octanoyl) transferase LipB [Armatimonadota bacterium]
MGRVEYGRAHALQTALVEAVSKGRAPDTVLLLEHEPVITVGRSASDAELSALRSTACPSGPFPVVHVERGGSITFHAPGQLVAYPIVHLDRAGRDLHRWLTMLERAVVATLSHYGLAATPGNRQARGVWVDGKKVASVGVAVRRWVSFHGVAINVRAAWRPPVGVPLCRMSADAYTSLEEMGVDVELLDVALVLASQIARECGFRGI